MRRFLDALYLAAGGVAALAVLAICLIVTAQVGLNILARLGGPSLSYTIPSYADFAGFLLAAASFLALAHTLRAGGHIRVNLALGRLPPRPRWVAELATLGLGTVLAAYATGYSANLVAQSYRFGDKSTGMVAVPIWIPQLSLVLGLALLALAFADTFVESLRAGRTILKDEGTE